MLTLIGAADVDDANANLSVAITNVVNGSVALSGGTGGAGTTFTFTPTANFVGNMTFDYQASDDELPVPASSAIGTATVALSAVNDAPTVNPIAADTGTEDVDQVYTHAQMLTLIGAADVDDANANLSVAITNVINGSVALSGGTGGAGTTFTFTPTANFVGNMTFDYQVSDDELPVPASSAIGTATVALSNVNDAPVGLPTITGTVTEDQILSADTTGISDIDGLGAFSYQWLRGGVVIGGATASTYTLGDADVGNQISVRVSYTDGQGTPENVTSAQTAPVVNVNDTPVGVPNIIGTATEDQTLTIDTTGISDADGLGTFSYQWLRGGVAISGATATTYTLGDADVGTQISAQVSYVDGHGTAEGPLVSAQTAAVLNINDAPAGSDNTVSTLRGTAYVFSAADFGFSDPYDNPSNSLQAIRIATLPDDGILTDNGIAVVTGQFVSVSDINAGGLVFTPATGFNENGFAAFTFQVQDNGGGADLDPIARTMTVRVDTPVPLIDPTTPVAAPASTPEVLDTSNDDVDDSSSDSEDAASQTEQAILDGAATSSGASTPEQQSAVAQTQPITGIVISQPINLPNVQPSSVAADTDTKLTLLDIGKDLRAVLENSPILFQSSGSGITASMDRTNFDQQISGNQFFTAETGVQLSGVALSAGFVTWALRGAGLFASLLTSLPAWRHMDPLPVLKQEKKKKKKNENWSEDGDEDHEDIEDDVAAIQLWTTGDNGDWVWSNKSTPLIADSGWSTSKAGTELTMSFLDHVTPQAEPPQSDEASDEQEGVS